MTDFLAENNPCGQNILQLVSRGNATIAELLRLKDYTPTIFKLESKQEQQKYADIIADFSYFRISDAHDNKIDNNADLQDLDDEFRENNLEILTRFYLAFESIHQYVCDLNLFLSELTDGLFIQQTLESVLQDAEGKQLLCESLYLYGVMLLVVDLHIAGPVRERLLVSYHRYSARRACGDSNMDDVCKLLRCTGYVREGSSVKRPHGYPEEYFRRIAIDETFIDMVIGQLRLNDIYNQVAAYAHPGQRSVALGTQAAMLYICLFFSPNMLNSQTAAMREIVDKFFPDNWIVSIYMGITVNLVDSWEPYRAAKLALNNTLDSGNMKEIALKYGKSLQKLLPQTRNMLKEGALSEQTLLDNVERVLNVVRECNVTLRWLMLHTIPCSISYENNKRCRQLREQVAADSKYKTLEVFELLLNTSQLELKIKDMYKHLLVEKENKWSSFKSEGSSRMSELSEVFSGAKPLTRIKKNNDLELWFKDISVQIDSLSIDDLHASGRKIRQLIPALEEVQEFHQLETNMQVKQFIVETIQFLHQMIRTINTKEDVLINLQIVSDLSYAWDGIEHYTSIMQTGIKNEPSLVIKLRATFLKLASALEIPLLRINQAHSDDLVSVSQYYSSELVNYVRKVLQIIPYTMFEILSQIIYLQTSVIKELPTRLDKDKLREYAQLDDRMEVARLTHSVSVFTEGIRMMNKTLVGVICIDPKQLLEDGIRKELVRHIAEALHKALTFGPKYKPEELTTKLDELVGIIDGYRRSFEYIQDYVNINGLKIWQEEVSRIISYNVEQECNSFLRNKIQDWQSKYQSIAIPIPVFPQTDQISINFIGRLAREITRLTDPKVTVYVELSTAWFDYKTHKELLNLKLFSKISNSIGPAGLTGLDSFYSFMIVTELQNMLSSLQRSVFKEQSWLDMLKTLEEDLTPNFKLIANPAKFYTGYTNRAFKVWPQILEWVLKVGHMQLLRKHIGYELNISCKFNSKNLESSLRTMNEAILSEVRAHWRDPSKPLPPGKLLQDLSVHLQWAGLSEPFSQIYVTTRNSHHMPLVLFMFVIVHLGKLTYFKNIGGLMAKKVTDQMDGMPFIIGVQTVLRQFHSEIKNKFLSYMGQYVLSHVDSSLSIKNPELAQEAVTALHFLEIFVIHAGMVREDLTQYIPEPILDQYQFMSTKTL